MKILIISTNPLSTTLQMIYDEWGRSPKLEILAEHFGKFEAKVLPWLEEYRKVSDRYCDLNNALGWLYESWLKFGWYSQLPSVDDYLFYEVEQCMKFDSHPQSDSNIHKAIWHGSDRVGKLAREKFISVSDQWPLAPDSLDLVNLCDTRGSWVPLRFWRMVLTDHQDVLAGEYVDDLASDPDYQAMVARAEKALASASEEEVRAEYFFLGEWENDQLVGRKIEFWKDSEMYTHSFKVEGATVHITWKHYYHDKPYSIELRLTQDNLQPTRPVVCDHFGRILVAKL